MNPVKKLISSDKPFPQVLGALFKWRSGPFFMFLLFTAASAGVSTVLAPGAYLQMGLLFVINLLAWLIIKVCRILTDIYNLRKNENGITACQITILVTMGLWLIGFVLIFDIHTNPKVATAIGIIGVVLTWIFQDTVKGIAAFINLRRNHLLNIGDWIQVPDLGVDGQVTRVTLTTVTLENWDTTTSTIPISALQSKHFMNFQNMSEGRTYGRQMKKTFIFDTGWIHPVSEDEAESLRSCKHGISDYLPDNDIKVGVLNAQLYRTYLYHWLMNDKYVSQKPRLIVRWMDHKDSGMTLQVYAFITETNLAAFEWEQSRIIEHVLLSSEWFGMALYQSPSAYDVSNSNIFMADRPASYRKEENR